MNLAFRVDFEIWVLGLVVFGVYELLVKVKVCVGQGLSSYQGQKCLTISPEDPVDGALDVVVCLPQRLDALLCRHAHGLQHRQAVGVGHEAGRGGGGTCRGPVGKL